MEPKLMTIYTLNREERAYAGPMWRFHESHFPMHELQRVYPLDDKRTIDARVVHYNQPVVEIAQPSGESVFIAIEPRLARLLRYVAGVELRGEYEEREDQLRDVLWASQRAHTELVRERARFLALPWWRRVLLALRGELA